MLGYSSSYAATRWGKTRYHYIGNSTDYSIIFVCIEIEIIFEYLKFGL